MVSTISFFDKKGENMEKSKLHLKLEEYIDLLDINYLLLNIEDYIFSKINEIEDDFFNSDYSSNDKNFIEKKRKKNRDLINLILESKYEEHLKKYKKYLPRENNLDEAIVYILSLFVDKLNNEVILKDIYDTMEIDYPTELIVNDLTKRALANIRCLYMADCRVINRLQTYYKIDLEKWFDDSRRYTIHNKELLKSILPLLVAYLKSNKGLTTDNYFEIVEEIIEEFLKPIEYSQSNYNLEYQIFQSISSNKDITIVIDGVNGNLVNKTISPIKININSDNSKTIEYYRKMKDKIDTSKVETILLSKIFAINDKGISAKDFYLSQLPKDKQKEILSLNKSFMINDVIKYEIIPKLALEPTENEEQIILECNSVLLEYFLYKPLKKQSTFKTEDELKYFEEVYSITPKDNKFYVVATDTITNASSSVLKCLGEVKVLTPTSLTDFVSEKIQKHNSLLISS
ncbi:hypothetical protein AELL_1323 [Arcobacter ellisii]|uniref:Uncharacterized protein n=2 Tax=Arcobacter ellisii TaxID=913109 RepID=A0A347U808_9BACT|nr:hypothetical protein AELL_1323 [Arcobacter ellisii]RXI30310.1 hypothetical protein CP962_08150 [Arcobacter ellisii]